LVNGEQALWHRMSGPDRRHAVGVAQDAIRLLGSEEVPREVTAAALLHDVGKVESSLGTFARVGVTFAAIAVGRTRLMTWADRRRERRSPSARARVSLYLSHDRVGAELLRRAGSHPLTVSWAAEHHLAAERWTIDPTVSAALKAADGD
jgi:putative nucleotidyltransferase with HDIG domain